MLAGNRLEHLPDEISDCVNLELVRLSANRLLEFPTALLSLPRLSWLALAGNPFSEIVQESHVPLEIDWKDIELQDTLGEGASGTIFKARCHHESHYSTRPVAIKIFKASVTSDGLPASELKHSIAAGRHANLIHVMGKITGHPANSQGLVMELIDSEFVNLAKPPDFDSCTRDCYSRDQEFAFSIVLRLARGVAAAAAHLHQRGILHGDLYGHNVLWKPDGECLVGDFGASSIYQLDSETITRTLQAFEVRAFGCLLEELLHRCKAQNHEMIAVESLWKLQLRCVSPVIESRPLFAEILIELRRHQHIDNRAANLNF